MTIIYKDGSTLDCTTIEIYGNDLYVDEYRTVNADDIERITDDGDAVTDDE